MCGRYGLFGGPAALAAAFEPAFGADAAASLRTAFEALDPPLAPRYNLAPTQRAPVVVRARDADAASTAGSTAASTAASTATPLVVRWARWGLIPHWVDDPATFRATLVNARAETAHAKPSFRDALRHDRCLVPVDGFYEWREAEGGKRPYWIRRRDRTPLLLAGLHAVHEGATPPDSFTILTTRPGPLMVQLHDRQPVVLPPPWAAAWMEPGRRRAEDVAAFLAPAANDALEAIPVSRAVNRPTNDAPDLLTPEGDALRT
ncbi:MAG: SOS response-associated peptidase [Trueperaceae bacterium]|nr:SOS response-associated peptidase [Trueperaceae bacterium]